MRQQFLLSGYAKSSSPRWYWSFKSPDFLFLKLGLIHWNRVKYWHLWCFQYFKDTRWKQITTVSQQLIWNKGVLSIFQRYKMKANHNAATFLNSLLQGAFNISKIQDESKSQPNLRSDALSHWCFQYFKDTRWKQITTIVITLPSPPRCFQYFKDTRWKQITTGFAYQYFYMEGF